MDSQGWKNWNLAQVALAELLLTNGALQTGEYRLADGSESPYKINLRVLEQGGPLPKNVIDALGRDLYTFAQARKLVFEYSAGVPNAGNALAESFSRQGDPGEQWPTEVLYLKKTGGKITGLKYSGSAQKGDPVILIDDVATRATRKQEAIRVLWRYGLVVTDVLVVVEREEGARQALALDGRTLHSLFKISDIVEFARVYSLISAEDYNRITSHILAHRPPGSLFFLLA